MWRSRGLRALPSPVSELGTADADAITPSACPSRAGTRAASSACRSVSTCAAISPVSALTARCSLRHCRRARPCFPHPTRLGRTAPPRAVQHEVDRASTGRDTRLPVREDPAAAAQRCVVGDGQRSSKQAQHAAAERLGLPQGQVEHEPQGKHEFDGQLAIQRLPAETAPFRCRPAGQRRLVQPQRQVAASPQSGLIGWPVGNAVAGARNAMAASGVVLERHGRKVAPPPPARYRAASAHQHRFQQLAATTPTIAVARSAAGCASRSPSKGSSSDRLSAPPRHRLFAAR